MPDRKDCADLARVCRIQEQLTTNPDTAAVFRELAEHYESEAKRLAFN